MSSHKEIFTRRPQQDESHMRPPYYLLWTRKKAWKTLGNGCNSPINTGSETYKLKFNSLICDFGQITCPLWASTSLFGGVWVITYRTQRLRGSGGWRAAVVWLELRAGDARLGLKLKQAWMARSGGWKEEAGSWNHTGAVAAAFLVKGEVT